MRHRRVQQRNAEVDEWQAARRVTLQQHAAAEQVSAPLFDLPRLVNLMQNKAWSALVPAQ